MVSTVDAARLFTQRLFVECIEVLDRVRAERRAEVVPTRTSHGDDGGPSATCAEARGPSRVASEVQVDANRALAEYFRDGRGNVLVFATTLDRIARRAPALPQHAVPRYNRAVTLLHLRLYDKALEEFSSLYAMIDLLEDALAVRVCCALIDVSIERGSAETLATAVLEQLEVSALSLRAADAGRARQPSAAESSAQTSSANGAANNRSGARRLARPRSSTDVANGAQQRSRSGTVASADVALLQLDLPRWHEPLVADEGCFPRIDAHSVIQTVRLYRAKVAMATGDFRTAKRELKELIGDPASCSWSALLLKAQLECKRGNAAKSIKILMNVPGMRSSSLHLHAVGCALARMGMPRLALLQFSRSLAALQQMRSDATFRNELPESAVDHSFLTYCASANTLSVLGDAERAGLCYEEARGIAASYGWAEDPDLLLRRAQCLIPLANEHSAIAVRLLRRAIHLYEQRSAPNDRMQAASAPERGKKLLAYRTEASRPRAARIGYGIALCQLAYLLLKELNFAEALVTAEKALAQSDLPNNISLACLLYAAEAAAVLGRRRSAAIYANQAKRISDSMSSAPSAQDSSCVALRESLQTLQKYVGNSNRCGNPAEEQIGKQRSGASSSTADSEHAAMDERARRT